MLIKSFPISFERRLDFSNVQGKMFCSMIVYSRAHKFQVHSALSVQCLPGAESFPVSNSDGKGG